MNGSENLHPWSVQAVNLPEHADNPIHTDDGAKAAGYPAAIVAGTTIYAYMTRPAVEAWGSDWITGGGGELRLRRAVLDRDLVECGPTTEGGGTTVEAKVDGEVKATLDLWPASDAPPMRDGEPLPDVEMVLDEEWGRYGVRCGDDLDLYQTATLAHPAIWPSLANRVFKTNLITGPWIHTRSRIHHRGPANLGDRLRITSNVVDRFETRAGKRAVIDMEIAVDDRPVVSIEHEALTELNEG